jgi:hypothetical protein
VKGGARSPNDRWDGSGQGHMQNTARLNAALTRDAVAQAPAVAAHFESHPNIRMLLATGQYQDLPVTPAILQSQLVSRIERACQTVFAGIAAVHHGVFHSDIGRFADFLRLTPIERACLEIPAIHPWAIVAKCDVVINRNRTVIVDPNITSGVGGIGVAELVTRVQLTCPSIASRTELSNWSMSDSIDGLTDLLRLRAIHDDPSGLIALVEWAEYFRRSPLAPGPWIYEFLERELAKRGLRTRLCAFEDLSINESGVYIQGERVAAIYRFFDPPEPDSDPHPDSRFRLGAFAGLLQAVANRQVELIDDFRGYLLGSKVMFVPLTDERYAANLPVPVTRQVRAVVPWSRIVEDRRTVFSGKTISLLDWALQNRERLVLKPARGFNGIGIVVGCDTTQGQWGSSLNAAIQGDELWVLQQFIKPGTTGIAQLSRGKVVVRSAHSIYGAYMFDGHLCGLNRRNSVLRTKGFNVSGHFGVSSVLRGE